MARLSAGRAGVAAAVAQQVAKSVAAAGGQQQGNGCAMRARM